MDFIQKVLLNSPSSCTQAVGWELKKQKKLKKTEENGEKRKRKDKIEERNWEKRGEKRSPFYFLSSYNLLSFNGCAKKNGTHYCGYY